jgi:hypothetical protein
MFELAYEREEQVVELLFHLVHRPRHRLLQAGPPAQPERSWLFTVQVLFKGTPREISNVLNVILMMEYDLKSMRGLEILFCTVSTEHFYEKNSFIW